MTVNDILSAIAGLDDYSIPIGRKFARTPKAVTLWSVNLTPNVRFMTKNGNET